MNAEPLAEMRRLNVVVHEDDATISMVGPCPTYAHRRDSMQVAITHIVTFRCPYGDHEVGLCEPCVADRRADGPFRCSPRDNPDGCGEDCPGSTVVRARSFRPVVRRK